MEMRTLRRRLLDPRMQQENHSSFHSVWSMDGVEQGHWNWRVEMNITN
jgi:hypothetical protein